MPHDMAVKAIDAIVDDWRYWMQRANELIVLGMASSGNEAENADEAARQETEMAKIWDFSPDDLLE